MPINTFSSNSNIKISLLYTNLSSTYLHKEVAEAVMPEMSIRSMFNLLQHKHSLYIIAGQIHPLLLVSKQLQKESINLGLSS
jgi:hypothetical protein